MPPDALPSRARPWMRWWLVAAGIYNLTWGTAVVVLPDVPFVAAGIEPLQGTARAIWQCLGMVIGVYGIGYIAASSGPTVHWPIVLVGFLGKIFGPVGFVWTAFRGDIPWNFAWTILTNDLIWWIPFAAILIAAWADRGRSAATIRSPAPLPQSPCT